jgi:hypothetical protein
VRDRRSAPAWALLCLAAACARHQVEDRFFCGGDQHLVQPAEVPPPPGLPVPGLVEAESFHDAIGRREVEADAQASSGHLVVAHGSVWLKYRLDVAQAGDYDVQFTGVATNDEGAQIELRLDLQPLTPRRSLYRESRPWPVQGLGSVALPAGRHVLEVRVAGRAAASVVLDWLRFTLDSSAPGDAPSATAHTVDAEPAAQSY